MTNQCTSTNWEVCYRYKDSLATCNVWAPDEAQAEKKFKARKEFEYDPSLSAIDGETDVPYNLKLGRRVRWYRR